MDSKEEKKFYAIFKDGKNIEMGYYRDIGEVYAKFKAHVDDDIEVFSLGFAESSTDPPKGGGDAPHPRKTRKERIGILCEETGELFPNLSAAAEQMGIPYKSIDASLRRRVRAYGYMFTYV